MTSYVIIITLSNFEWWIIQLNNSKFKRNYFYGTNVRPYVRESILPFNSNKININANKYTTLRPFTLQSINIPYRHYSAQTMLLRSRTRLKTYLFSGNGIHTNSTFYLNIVWTNDFSLKNIFSYWKSKGFGWNWNSSQR